MGTLRTTYYVLESGQHLGLGFLQRAGEVATGGERVTATAKLECHLCDVKAWHGSKTDFDTTVPALDEDSRDIRVIGADEKTGQPSVAVVHVADRLARCQRDGGPSYAVLNP
jgi:hypothetical protein